jgi:molecular chaperone DnaJ
MACGGIGLQRQQHCSVCAAQGRVVRSDAVIVSIPPGTADGLRIRLPEQGHAGRGGGGHGDLYVTVHVTPHERFRREGDDVHMRVPVAVHEAVLGARIEVESFDGPVRLRIPPGAQAGQRFCIPNRGAASVTGGRGDLIVETHLVLPAAVDDESRELMRRFGERNAEDVRKDWAI